MRDDDFHHPLRESAAAMFRHNEDISHPRERRIVRHDARKPDLLLTVVQTKSQRILDRARDNLTRPPLSPVRMITDEVVNQIYVEPRTIGADRVLPSLPNLLLKRT